MKYTKDQIVTAIKKWQKVVESMGDKTEVKEDDEAVKKSLASKIKEGVEAVGSAASIAKSAAAVASSIPEGIKLMKELIAAINRGAAAVEKFNASHGAK